MLKDDLEQLRAETARALEAHRKRLVRRGDAIRADIARVAAADEAARLAQLAVPTAASLPRGTSRVEVTDYATGAPVIRAIDVDPALAPRASLERIFQRARRLRRGEPIAAARLRDAEGAIVLLDAALASLAAATDEEGVLEARAAAKLRAPSGTRAKPTQERKPPYRTFRTPRGDVLVGRGANKNDELTFHVAKPYHLWLHVRGAPGAHVVVPLKREQACPSDLLVDAAHLAAHFSDVRGERTVEVSYVARKFVRKPRGSPAGTVTMEREKVLALRVEPTRTEHLLALEIDQNE